MKIDDLINFIGILIAFFAELEFPDRLFDVFREIVMVILVLSYWLLLQYKNKKNDRHNDVCKDRYKDRYIGGYSDRCNDGNIDKHRRYIFYVPILSFFIVIIGLYKVPSYLFDQIKNFSAFIQEESFVELPNRDDEFILESLSAFVQEEPFVELPNRNDEFILDKVNK